jgi:phosphonate transport system substrate-binding protein
VIARKGLEPALKEAFIRAMLQLNEPDHRYLLQHLYGPDGYVLTDHRAYEPVAEVAKRYGLLG